VVSCAEIFDRNRPLLFSIAYRMTGSVMEAEDAVQEAYLRWQRASEDEVRSPSAYLSKVVTRLCIDRLRSARARREQFEDGSPQSVASIEVAEGSIRAIRLVVNPEKLGNVPPLERAEREED